MVLLIHPGRDSEFTAAVVQVGPDVAQASGRPWHPPCGGFAYVQNGRPAELWMFPPRF